MMFDSSGPMSLSIDDPWAMPRLLNSRLRREARPLCFAPSPNLSQRERSKTQAVLTRCLRLFNVKPAG